MITEIFRFKHETHAQDYQHKPHFHDVNEILFSTNDDATMLINQTSFPIHAGTLIFIAQGNLHAKFNRNIDVINSYVIHYPTALLQEISTVSTNLYDIFGECCTFIQLSNEDQQQFLGRFNRIEQCKDGLGSDLRRLALFGDILLSAVPLLRDERLPADVHHFRDDAWLAPILHYIDTHLSEPLSLDALAAHFFTRKSSLCHTFRRKTGMTVMTYINKNRIRSACILLRQGASVQSAAADSGFSTVEHFIRTFRAFTDTTPGKYAASIRKGDRIEMVNAVYQPSVDAGIPIDEH